MRCSRKWWRPLVIAPGGLCGLEGRGERGGERAPSASVRGRVRPGGESGRETLSFPPVARVQGLAGVGDGL